jgi:predicted RNase H-like nuclease (RuvC/YqgF family)
VLQILLSLKQGLMQSLSTPKKTKWYDISLSSLKKNLDLRSKLFERYPRDPHVRGALFSTLKTYRKIRKFKIKEYHRKIIDQLDSLLENNPKKYWSLLYRYR